MTQDEMIKLAKKAGANRVFDTEKENYMLIGNGAIIAFTELILASQTQPTPSQSEPIYQFYNTVNGQWLDISKDAYSINSFSKKRIVYLQPQPQTVRE